MTFFPRILGVCFFILLYIPVGLMAQNTCVTDETGSMTYNGLDFFDRPTPFYSAGEVVEICFSLENQFQTPDNEWIHGVFIVETGLGLDFTTMAPGPPPTACSNGNWKYYTVWTRCHTNCSETTFRNGYGFDGTAGGNDCPGGGGLDGNPGNNYGDVDGACGLVFCWTFTAIDPPGGLSPAEAYGVEVRITADGISGSYRSGDGPCNSPCDADPQICFPPITTPTVDVLNNPCPGDLFQLQGSPVVPGIAATWTNAAGVVVAMGYLVNLPEGTYTLSLAKPNCAPKEFEVDVALEIPVLEYTGPDDGTFFCYGEAFSLNIDVTNAAVNFIEWVLDGTVVGNGNAYNVAEATPDDGGLYSVVVNYGDGCDTTLSFNILVGANPEPIIATNPADGRVCEGESITFTARRANGTPFPNGWTLDWNSPAGGGFGSPMTIDMAFGPGDQIMNLSITDPDGCVADFDYPFTVNEVPVADIFPEFNNICRGESITLTPTVSVGLPPLTYRWGPANSVTTLTYTVSPPYNTQLELLYLEVTDDNGCIGYSNYADIIINDLPARPVITCDPICVSELRFSWTSTRATYYHIYANINFGGDVLIDDQYIGTSYLFTGLNPGDRVDFRVVPFTGDLTDGCEGPSQNRICNTPLVSSPGFVVSYDDPFCTDGNGMLPLTVSAGDPGVFTFNSTDLGITNLTANASGTTMIPVLAPTVGNSATYTLDISYVNLSGSCPADTSIVLTVIQAPDPAFTLDALTACGTNATFTATLTTASAPGDVYTLSLPNPGAGNVTNNNDDTWTVNVTSAGTYELIMAASNASNASCTDTFRTQVTLAEPPAAPFVECGLTGLDFVTFSWGDTGHDSYVVNEVNLPAGAIVNRNGNVVTVTGLTVNDAVTISVTGLTTGCSGVTSNIVTCVAESCPDIIVMVDPLPDLCANSTDDITITYVASGSDNSGIAQFLLNGAPTPTTIPAGTLMPGRYVVRVNFEEGCSYFGTDTFNINPVPTSDFAFPDGPICTNTNVLGAVAGAERAGWTYTWSTDNSAVTTPGADQTERNFRWSAPGRYFVRLAVTSEFGCVSEVSTDSIDVVAPLLIPVVTCDTVDTDFVVFTWPAQALVDSFGVSINGGPVFYQDATTLFVGGLAVDSTVNIAVTAFGDTPCPILTPGTASCSSVSCPSLVVQRPADETFCGDFNPSRRTLLTTTVTGSDPNGGGVLTFSGPGVIRIGNDYFFDTDTAGVGIHLLLVDFVEGQCFGSRQFTYTVVERPVGEIVVNGQVGGADLCVNQPFTFGYVGNITPADSDTFYWVFLDQPPLLDGPADPLDTTGFETYVGQYLEPGPYRIHLVIKTPSCDSDTIRAEGISFSPPVAPTVVCDNTDLNSVTFAWGDVIGAEGYNIIRDGFPTVTTNDTTVTYDNLATGEPVTIRVESLTTNVCGLGGISDPVTCTSDPCPDFDIDLSGIPDQICILDGDEFISLTDLVVTGGIGNGLLFLSGDGVARDTFFASQVPFNEAGTTYTIEVAYLEAGPCGLTTSFDVTVFARPTAFLTDPGDQCLGDTMRVTIGSTNFVSNANIVVNWDGGTVVPDNDPNDNAYRVTYATPGTKNITATVTSSISGCPSEEVPLTVEIFAPLTAPVLTCSDQQLEEVTFSWDPVPGATAYSVTTSSGETADLTAAVTSFTITGLSPDQSVTITVTATGDAPCGDGPPATADCTSLPCPPGVVLATTPDTDICLDGTQSPLALTAELTAGNLSGTLDWSGTGVVTNPDGSQSFDPAGLPAGEYPLLVAYDGPANCDSDDGITIRLFDLPVVTFNAIPAQLCEGEEFNVFFTGTAADAADYDWNFDGAAVTDLDNESYLLRWDAPGDKMVSLTVADNCTATATFSIEVTPTLAAPVPSCARQDLDGVLFTWPAVAAATEGYRISINDGPFSDVQAATEFFAGNLAFGESVSIRVRSVRSGTTCDESAPSVSVTCAARVCPPISLAPAAAQNAFCSADQSDAVLLSANPNGDDGTGTITWTGPGAVFANGSWTFDPVLAGVGVHTLSVRFVQELLCDYENTLVMTVTATPEVNLLATANLICDGNTVGISLQNGEADVSYTFDFGGGDASEISNQQFNMIFPAPGTYEVAVTATRNVCTSTDLVTITVEEQLSSGSEVTGLLEVCEGADDPVLLSDRLAGATFDGVWRGIPGTASGNLPGGSLDAATGTLRPGTLNPGAYVFVYEVSGTACPTVSTEVTVNILGAPVADAGSPQLLTCTMGMVSLDGSNSETGAGYAYEWTSTNPNAIIMDADQLMIDVGQPGTYQLRITNAIGCTAVSEVIVEAETEAPVMELEVSQITCFASDNGAISVTNVSGGRPPYTFRFNGEDRGASTLYASLVPAEYNIQVTDANGCFSNIVLDISQPEQLSVRLIFPGDSTEVAAGDDIFITASVSGGGAIDTLLWEPDSLANGEGRNGIFFTASETRMISVTVVDELGCSATDRQVLLVRRDRPVYFPTAFSPNGDNNNDIYFIGGDLDQIVEIRDFMIFDRWGEVLHNGSQRPDGNAVNGNGSGFLPNDPSFGWDGFLKGKPLNPQVCVYTATVEFTDGEVVVYKGDFVIMR